MSNYYSGKNILRKPLPYRFFNVTLILIITNVAIYLMNRLFPITFGILALQPDLVFQHGFFWQVASYMFVHSFHDYFHILFNMLVLFMFGSQLELKMGSFEFLLFYLLTGIATGVVMLFMGMTVVGASGALFALMLAFATYFPDTTILLFFVIPLRAPLAILVIAGLSVIFQLTGAFGGIAHLGHLAGTVFGFLYFIIRLDINPIRVFRDAFR
jgi:membrane associated rhomboid family serine protease